MSNVSVLQSLFRYKAWANEELFVEVAKLDADRYASERHDAIRILNHVFVVDRIFAAHLRGQAHTYTATNTAETPELAELRAAVASSDQAFLAYLADLDPAGLEQTLSFRFTDGAHGRMSREEMLMHVITHGGYHRGAVGRILVQASLTPPRDTLTVFLHRSEPERRTPV